jgi:hypothetical protein
MKNRRFNSVFEKLAAQEESFFASDFFSPVVRGKPIRVKLSGVVMNLNVTRPKNFEGWGVFRPLSPKTARFVREPTMTERRNYLDLFPVLRLIVCAREDEQWFGIPSNSADTRFKVSGLVPIRLAQEIQMFETVQTRFDGANCWFDQSDPAASLRNATVLRDALAQETDVAKVIASGLSKEEKQAYATALIRELENKKDRNEEHIKLAIERAGAEYRSYVDRGDSYTVEYVVEGENHRSVVKKDTLEVQSAGICLSGYDRNFDLQSLVGVIREGINRRRIVRVGENDYGYNRHEPGTYDEYDDYD